MSVATENFKKSEYILIVISIGNTISYIINFCYILAPRQHFFDPNLSFWAQFFFADNLSEFAFVFFAKWNIKIKIVDFNGFFYFQVFEKK